VKVGDLVRMRDTLHWNGQMGIITKIPKTHMGRWSIRLASGELIATLCLDRMEMISENR